MKESSLNSLEYRCILYSPKDDCYKLTGFEWASINFSESPMVGFESKGKGNCFGTADKSSEDLVYRSPEQTGRVNRRIDSRSDIYSLGACFYKFLTGVADSYSYLIL